ncbi:hypothetical protein AURDEDRAFT_172098 [Auricularia subglabra TFB-10046 SS5]|nr:hypothetical protein AURDEDRAFT_172098 [Auricularia subglabra TFB-10046 SS5]
MWHSREHGGSRASRLVIFLLVAFIASLLASVSLPLLPALEVVRAHFSGTIESIGKIRTIREDRFGVWAHCWYYVKDGDRECSKEGHDYVAVLTTPEGQKIVGRSWTRGLAVTPVATGVTFIALVLALIPGTKYALFGSMTAFLASFLMLLAFAIDIALLAKVKSAYHVPGSSINAGAGFWLTFVSFIFLCVSGCTLLFGNRRGDDGIELGGIFKRFKR